MRVTRRRGEASERVRDALAVEEPLEIRLSWVRGGERQTESLAVTMRTPGDDFDLVAGFLYGEGIVRHARDIERMSYCRNGEAQEYNVVEVRLDTGSSPDLARLRRSFHMTSACGVCGKASLDAVTAIGCRALPAGPTVELRLLTELPDRLRAEQAVFESTGGLHAAGLFGVDGSPRWVREDVGRHNAVDKIVGTLQMNSNISAKESILLLSGRAGFELIQKAVRSQIPVVASIGAPSSLAVELAQTYGLTLIGFLRENRFNIYSGNDRFVPS